MVINDPHIKADPDWPFFCVARDEGHFVKDRDGGIYYGKCWPGIVMFYYILTVSNFCPKTGCFVLSY